MSRTRNSGEGRETQAETMSKSLSRRCWSFRRITDLSRRETAARKLISDSSSEILGRRCNYDPIIARVARNNTDKQRLPALASRCFQLKSSPDNVVHIQSAGKRSSLFSTDTSRTDGTTNYTLADNRRGGVPLTRYD